MTPPTVDQRLRDPGYTPSVKHVPRLVELLAGDDDAATLAARALLRLGDAAVPALLDAFPPTTPPLRGRLVDVIGDLARERPGPLRDFLLARLDDADAKARRNAVIALAHHESPEVERALLDYWRREPRADHRRSVARSLARVGGDASLALLRMAPADDPELARACREAVLALERRAARETVSRIDGSLPLPDGVVAIAHTRPGFEALCGEEVDPSWRPRVAARGAVELRPRGRLRDVFRSRTMLSFGFPLPPRPVGADVADALADAIASPEALALFRAFTDGAVRYRVEWAGAGHRRGATQRVADRVARANATLVNDPRESTWEVVARQAGATLHVELVPKRLDDPRFAYRKADVPAASHPTLAAALARVAGARPDDVVWDPFVGSGLEICERALLGPYRRMLGSDLDPSALEAARANVTAAGLGRIDLGRRDARDAPPRGVTLVITNPPLGQRVGFGDDVRDLLDVVLRNVAAALPEGGRVVWVSPAPVRTLKLARSLGLTAARRMAVTLAGLDAELQRFDRPGG